MTADDPAIGGPAPLRSAFNPASLAVAGGFALTAAIVFSPLFIIPFVELLGRTLLLAGVLLAVFALVRRLPQRWLPRWLPRWLLATVAVGLAAPLTTFALYLALVGGDVHALLSSEPRMTGFVLIAGSALVLGLVVTLSAQLREREARARSLALQVELARSRLERQTADARLAQLQAQIEPHFLFNTLANVQALVESGSPRAAPVLASLIQYLRAALPALHEREPDLGRELTRVSAYLELMRLRMPDRLEFALAVDPALHGLPFPPMALLTLVENAVRHGIDPSEAGGRIEVGAAREEAARQVRLWVADTGLGLSEHAAPGTGLANLRQRLQAQYGPRAELRLEENTPHGLRAEIVVPT